MQLSTRLLGLTWPELHKYAFDPLALAAKEAAIKRDYKPVAWKETAQFVFDSLK